MGLGFGPTLPGRLEWATLSGDATQEVPTAMTRRAVAWGRMGLLALLVWAVDQGVKAWIRATIPPYGVMYPFPWAAHVFRLTHLGNTGVAFGLLQDAAFVDALVVAVLLLMVFLYLRRMPWHDPWVQVAAGLQLGGALGNVTDRLLRGYVTDYLDFYVRVGSREYHYPPFNLADAAIVSGVVLLLWALSRASTPQDRTEPSTSVPSDVSNGPQHVDG